MLHFLIKRLREVTRNILITNNKTVTLVSIKWFRNSLCDLGETADYGTEVTEEAERKYESSQKRDGRRKEAGIGEKVYILQLSNVIIEQESKSNVNRLLTGS